MTLSTRLRRRFAAAEADSEEGSLILVLLVLLIAASLSVLVVGETVRQAVSTRYDAKRTHTLTGAEAGLQIALGQIRAATKTVTDPISSVTSLVGSTTGLPCGPFTGKVSATSTATYTVRITYLDFTGATIPCTPGSGTATVPFSAQLSSEGDDVTNAPGGKATSGDRTLTSTYLFQTTNANIAGGLLRVTQNTGLCVDAGTDTVAAKTVPSLQACNVSSTRQKFAYQPNQGLALVSTITPTFAGYCLTEEVAPLTDTAGAVIDFEPCGAKSTLVLLPPQEWSYDDNGGFHSAMPDASNAVGFTCMTPTAQSQNATLVTTAADVRRDSKTNAITGNECDAGAQGWSPDASVGAGAAAPAAAVLGLPSVQNAQLVNFQEFGRCFDITFQVLGSPNMIDYPASRRRRRPTCSGTSASATRSPPTPVRSSPTTRARRPTRTA